MKNKLAYTVTIKIYSFWNESLKVETSGEGLAKIKAQAWQLGGNNHLKKDFVLICVLTVFDVPQNFGGGGHLGTVE